MYAGFEVLAFPCNQFGWQEPGSNEEINEVVCSTFKAEFPLFQKVIVYRSEIISRSMKLEPTS